MPVLQSAELDDNRDGVIDRLEINVKMPIDINETITRFDALFYHTATLSSNSALCKTGTLTFAPYN